MNFLGQSLKRYLIWAGLQNICFFLNGLDYSTRMGWWNSGINLDGPPEGRFRVSFGEFGDHQWRSVGRAQALNSWVRAPLMGVYFIFLLLKRIINGESCSFPITRGDMFRVCARIWRWILRSPSISSGGTPTRKMSIQMIAGFFAGSVFPFTFSDCSFWR